MPRRVITTAKYKGEARAIFLGALEFREMSEAMSGLVLYEGLPERPAKEGEKFTVDITTLKIFKTKGYEMFIERLDKEACVLQSREKGGGIKMWDHNLSIRQEGEMVIWTDDVTIDAGLITPIAVRFGAYMYKRRHIYRKALNITTDIKPLNA